MATNSTDRPSQHVAAPRDPKRFRAPILVFAIAFGAYARVLDYDWTRLDDTDLIVGQQLWLDKLSNIFTAFGRSYFGSSESYYRPIVTISYLLDTQWSGEKPFGFHFTNVVLHAIAAVLVHCLLRRLRFGEWLSVMAAVLFAVHPALVEAVAWVPGRTDSLLTIFALGGWLALARDLESRSWKPKLAHVGCFVAALFTKETAVVLPGVYLAFLWLNEGAAERRRAAVRRARWLWAGWIASLAVYLSIRGQVIMDRPGKAADSLQAMLHQLPLVVASVGKLVFPVQLAPIAIAKDTLIWPGLVAIVILAGLARLATNATRSVLLLAAIVLVVPLLPGLGNADKVFLENRLYLPAVGLVIFLCEIGRVLQIGPRLLMTAAGVVTVAFATVTFRYQADFRDREAFSKAAVAASPHSSKAHLQVGLWYHEVRHDFDKAEEAYRKAIECAPFESLPHNNLGVLLMKREMTRWPEAERELRTAIVFNPGSALAHFNLGILLRDQRRLDEAATEWEQTLHYSPGHMDAMGELLVHFQRKHDVARASYYMHEISKAGMKFLPPGQLRPNSRP